MASSRRLCYFNPRLLRTLFLQLQQQQNTGQFCDLTLQGDGEGLHVHSCVLAACSPFLAKLLYCPAEVSEMEFDFTIQVGDSRRILNVPGISSRYLFPLVRYIYTSELEVLSTDVHGVLEAARWLQIPEIELLQLEGGRLVRPENGRKLNRNCLDSKKPKSVIKTNADKERQGGNPDRNKPAKEHYLLQGEDLSDGPTNSNQSSLSSYSDLGLSIPGRTLIPVHDSLRDQYHESPWRKTEHDPAQDSPKLHPETDSSSPGTEIIHEESRGSPFSEPGFDGLGKEPHPGQNKHLARQSPITSRCDRETESDRHKCESVPEPDVDKKIPQGEPQPYLDSQIPVRVLEPTIKKESPRGEPGSDLNKQIPGSMTESDLGMQILGRLSYSDLEIQIPGRVPEPDLDKQIPGRMAESYLGKQIPVRVPEPDLGKQIPGRVPKSDLGRHFYQYLPESHLELELGKQSTGREPGDELSVSRLKEEPELSSQRLEQVLESEVRGYIPGCETEHNSNMAKTGREPKTARGRPRKNTQLKPERENLEREPESVKIKIERDSKQELADKSRDRLGGVQDQEIEPEDKYTRSGTSKRIRLDRGGKWGQPQATEKNKFRERRPCKNIQLTEQQQNAPGPSTNDCEKTQDYGRKNNSFTPMLGLSDHESRQTPEKKTLMCHEMRQKLDHTVEEQVERAREACRYVMEQSVDVKVKREKVVQNMPLQQNISAGIAACSNREKTELAACTVQGDVSRAVVELEAAPTKKMEQEPTRSLLKETLEEDNGNPELANYMTQGEKRHWCTMDPEEVETVREKMRKAEDGLSTDVAKEVESMYVLCSDHQLNELEKVLEQILTVPSPSSSDLDVGDASPLAPWSEGLRPDPSSESDTEVDVLD